MRALEAIGKRDSTSNNSTSEDLAPEDLAPEDSNRKKLKTNTKIFLIISKEPIITYYISGVFGKYNINTRKINNAIINYLNRKINSEKFLEIYNAFISEIDNFSKAMNKKQPGSRGPNQNKLLNYGNEFKGIVGKSFNPSGSGLKILTTQQMFTRLPILLAQIKAGNNSRELKNEIRQLLCSLYRSKKINKTVYKNLIATI